VGGRGGEWEDGRGGEEGREGVRSGPPSSYATQQRVSMATLQCVQYGTGRPSAPKDGDKTAAASFTKIMPNRLAASSVFRLL
jgi:hypothetical protein